MKKLSRPGAIILHLAFLFPITFFSCNRKHSLFEKLDSRRTGISFINRIEENDSINPLDMEFLYNGGGVAVGDFNADGRPDLYFTASTTSNKLYLNKGQFHFEDVTDAAGVTGSGRWANGASVVDINNDGLDDIYICNSIRSNPAERTNILYVNQGLNADSVPTFTDQAAAYGLAENSLSVSAAFFDYDNDGDLDMYLVNTKLAQRDAVEFVNRNNYGDTSHLDFDKLYRNDWSDSLNHSFYTDVSFSAGIRHPGYGLGLAIADLNSDGWKDIYVTNDFYGSDQCYLNNQDGTFAEKVRTIFKHTSQNAMGNDIADINNDGLPDILAVDMNPEDNFRKKKNMSGNNYFLYQNMMGSGLNMLQYVRNTLQLNVGVVIKANDSIADPMFADIGFLAGVAQTDWSWNASIADFDNDGYRDIFITNGYPKDVTDHDFAAFRRDAGRKVPKAELISQIPQIKLANCAFKNSGQLTFSNVSGSWGLQTPSFSNGAVYADLDRDGDLDLVINNINDEAFVYQNTINSEKEIFRNYLGIGFNGPSQNRNGLGVISTIYYQGNRQVYENSPYRGYLSTVDKTAFFGLDSVTVVDSIVVDWGAGTKQVIIRPAVNQFITADYRHAVQWSTASRTIASASLFTDVTESLGISYISKDPDFIDFDDQRLLPHKLSAYGPGIACADVDGNGTDDLLVGGTGDFPATFLLQRPDGRFVQRTMPFAVGPDARRPENLGVLLFDADNDGDPDLYLANGSNQFVANTKNYQDQLFLNDGLGNFTLAETALPKNWCSKSCVKATDFDHDGDLDLFVGGRVLPGSYPLPVSSFIYRNDSRNGRIEFTDVTKQVAPDLMALGMTCDALWTDFNNDGWTDLMLVGEWMPIRFFRNNKGTFENISSTSGVNNKTGWWNSLTAGDFDNDGDIDYIAGNLGLNSFYKASDEYPVTMYAKDFDRNGKLDIVTGVYLPDQHNQLKEFPAQTRDDHIEQIPSLKKRFLTYKDFGNATVEDIFHEDEMANALKLRANFMSSAYLENKGNGRFTMNQLPLQAQVAPLYGGITGDINDDGNLDIAFVGNDFGTEVGNGRYDALNGLALVGNGTGKFTALTAVESGFLVPGDGKALVRLRGRNGLLLAASQNNGPLKIFAPRNDEQAFPIKSTDRFCIYTMADGKKRKEEFYYGSGYLSQSSFFISKNSSIVSIEVTSEDGSRRILK